jgi:hypothetical protein
MVKLGIPERAGFWVGGKSGRLLHGDVGVIASQIERTTLSARALRLELGSVATVLASDNAPRGEASEELRRQIADATSALAALDQASQATISEMVATG